MGGCERTGKLKAKAQETMAHGNKPQRGDRDIDSSELYRHWTNQTLPKFWLSLMAVAKARRGPALRHYLQMYSSAPTTQSRL
jgi:hypothetical protein